MFTTTRLLFSSFAACGKCYVSPCVDGSADTMWRLTNGTGFAAVVAAFLCCAFSVLWLGLTFAPGRMPVSIMGYNRFSHLNQPTPVQLLTTLTREFASYPPSATTHHHHPCARARVPRTPQRDDRRRTLAVHAAAALPDRRYLRQRGHAHEGGCCRASREPPSDLCARVRAL